MTKHAQLPHLTAFTPFLADANHVDIKTIDSALSLREFLAGMFSYMPAWMRVLYRVRAVFVRLLGMRQEGMPHAVSLHPTDIDFTPDAAAAFFVVTAAQEDAYYIAAARESHLTAHLGVDVEPLTNGNNRFHVVTIVHYHNWTGPVYFNVIRPFHHIVVRLMMRAAVRYNAPPLSGIKEPA